MVYMNKCVYLIVVLLILIISMIYLINQIHLQLIKAPINSEQKMKEMEISQLEERKLSIFLSNFVETSLPFFNENQINNSDMIIFGINHVMCNQPQYIEPIEENNKIRIAAIHIENAINKYLNKKVKHTSVLGFYSYKNGYYILSQSSGEPACFARMNKLLSIDNTNYIAYATVYCPGVNFTGDPYGSMKKWEQFEEDKPKMMLRIKTKIRLIDDGNSKRYILAEYLENK